MHKSYEEIEKYIAGVKASVRAGRYRIDVSRKRQANLDLYKDYVIGETGSKDILMNLTADDFCEAVKNKHMGFEQEIYIRKRRKIMAEIWNGRGESFFIYQV